MNDRVLTELEQLISEAIVEEIGASEGRVIPRIGVVQRVAHNLVVRLISQIQAVDVRPTECTHTHRANGDNLGRLLKHDEHRLTALAGRAAVVGDTTLRACLATARPSVLAARVAACSSAWTDLVPRIGAVVYQEGRAARCLA